EHGLAPGGATQRRLSNPKASPHFLRLRVLPTVELQYDNREDADVINSMTGAPFPRTALKLAKLRTMTRSLTHIFASAVLGSYTHGPDPVTRRPAAPNQLPEQHSFGIAAKRVFY
ncbi:hypothetical protein WG66_002071, partial [Moniliophthora roreri]